MQQQQQVHPQQQKRQQQPQQQQQKEQTEREQRFETAVFGVYGEFFVKILLFYILCIFILFNYFFFLIFNVSVGWKSNKKCHLSLSSVNLAYFFWPKMAKVLSES